MACTLLFLGELVFRLFAFGVGRPGSPFYGWWSRLDSVVVLFGCVGFAVRRTVNGWKVVALS
jgi:hypothetical protein